MIFRWLLLLVPLSAILAYGLHAPLMWIFIASLFGLVPLAEYVRRATDQLARMAGPTTGGLLNVSFGNVPELVLGYFILQAGQVEVVKAQITGAIIGNSLLGLGLAIVVGGFGREKQSFRKDRAGLAGSLLVLVVIALLLPGLFNISERSVLPAAIVADLNQRLSVGVAIVLILVYIGNLIYTFVTHRDIFAGSKSEQPAEWSMSKAIWVLIIATIGTAFEAELVSGALGEAASRLGLSPVFIGIILIAIAGNVSEYFSAIYFARENRMGIALSITVGSTIQIGLVIAPLLVLISAFTAHPLNLVFGNPLEMMAIGGAAFAVNAIAQDGETSWFEGVLLLAVYILFGIAFFYSTR
jgi:Ca2+:H+ antiporter